MPRRTTRLLRLIDRAVGVPLVAACGVLPKRRMPDPETVRRIGVLKSAAIGDTLLLAGMFEALEARFPAATLVMITGHDNAQAVPLLGASVDEHVVISPASPARSAAALRALRLDILLECGPWPRIDALLGALSGARYRVGFRVSGQARHYAFDRVVEHSSEIHQSENFRNLARAIGATSFPDPRLVLNVTPAAPCFEKPYVVFHPWSGGYMGHVKEWPLSRWIELGKSLTGERGPHIVISGGRGDVQRSVELRDALVTAGVASTAIAGQYDLPALGEIITGAALVVAVNTGVMHLSAQLGAPTICLDGPTPARRWGPLGPNARSVASTDPRSGYLDLGFEYGRGSLDCMQGITVQAVLDAARALAADPGAL